MYTPNIVPSRIEEFPAFFDLELAKIAESIRTLEAISVAFDMVSILPSKPFEGMVMAFTAETVTGGSAAGVWEYIGGSWVKL